MADIKNSEDAPFDPLANIRWYYNPKNNLCNKVPKGILYDIQFLLEHIKDTDDALKQRLKEEHNKAFREGWEAACLWYVQMDHRNFFKEEKQINSLLDESKATEGEA